MDFEAAADLVAALKPFAAPAKASRLEGFERLVRAASRVQGELRAAGHLMPPRPVMPRREGTASGPEPGTARETGGPSEPDPAVPDATSVEPLPIRAGGRGRPGTMRTRGPGLLLLLLLLAETR